MCHIGPLVRWIRRVCNIRAILTTTDIACAGLPKYSYKLKLDLLEVISTSLNEFFPSTT